MVKSGALRFEITIQEPVEAENDYGETTFTWQTYKIRYADIKQTAGREIINGDQVDAFFDSIFRIRAEEDLGIRTTFRILYKNRVYNIVHIKDPDERERMQEIFCQREETQANG